MNFKATALAALLAMSASVHAALIDYQAGDLVLSVYATGGTGITTNVSVSLGDAATSFRGDLNGGGVLTSSSYWTSTASNTWTFNTNLSSVLAGEFGANWASRTDLYWGISSVLTNSNLAGPVNGDPRRTVYMSAPVGQGDYTGIAGPQVGSVATAIVGFQTELATRDASTVYGSPLIAVYNQSATNSYESYQYNGDSNLADWGLFNRANANLSTALTVDRILALTTGANPTGSVGNGSSIGVFSIDSTTGNLVFQAVPEPSSIALFGAAALALGFVAWKRRRAVVQA